MHKNILFDTSCGSQNMGDYIICESVEREMQDILSGSFLVKYATHTPVTHFYQNHKKNPVYKYCMEADYKFIAGTNIIQYSMLRPWANLNVNLWNCGTYKDVILVGAGTDPNRGRMDLYTRLLYKKILSKEYIHSVRDERTRQVLGKLGFKAINTGCATLWMLNKEHCAAIPEHKAEKVIFTLTDYCKNRGKDQVLIDILKRNYKTVFFWIQGSGDFQYLQTFSNCKDIVLVGPNLHEYAKVLENNDIDYIGTRLHAGIYAMQHKKRSIIVTIDNRGRDMKNTYDFVAVERENIEQLEQMIYIAIKTEINIDQKALKEWRAQFK